MKFNRRKLYMYSIRMLLAPVLLVICSCQFEREYDESLLLSFTRGNNIWLMDIKGRNIRQITTTGNNDNSSWSPDGNRIVFQSSRDGNDEIFIMKPDGSGQTQLTFTSGADYCRYPTFMPDGETIVFYRMVNPTPYFFFIKTDGTFIRQIPCTSGVTRITVSPDGEFLTSMDGPNQITRTTISTGLLEIFVSPSSKYSPSYSSDGNNVVIISGTNIALLDTSLPLPVTPVNIYTFTGLDSPVWTPDSSFIYFIQNSNICRITETGSDFFQLTSISSDSNVCVQYKPR